MHNVPILSVPKILFSAHFLQVYLEPSTQEAHV